MDNIKPIPPFKRFCGSLGAFPEAFSDAMTVYEALEWLYRYLGTEVVPKTNEAIKLVDELKEYVEHYFDNLDVQEEINNKLDDMAESGELAEIIAQYLEVSSVLAFDTIAALSDADNLVDGSTVRVLGNANAYNGDGAYYKIRALDPSDVIDAYSKVALTNYPSLVAVRLPDYEVNLLWSKTHSLDNDVYNEIELTQNLIYQESSVKSFQGCCIDTANHLYQYENLNETYGNLYVFDIVNHTYLNKITSVPFYHGNDLTYKSGYIYAVASYGASGSSEPSNKVIKYNLSNGQATELSLFDNSYIVKTVAICKYGDDLFVMGTPNANAVSLSQMNVALVSNESSYVDYSIVNDNHFELTNNVVCGIDVIDDKMYVLTDAADLVIEMNINNKDHTLVVTKVYRINEQDTQGLQIGEVEGFAVVPSGYFGKNGFIVTSIVFDDTSIEAVNLRIYNLNIHSYVPPYVNILSGSYWPRKVEYIYVKKSGTNLLENGSRDYPFRTLMRAIEFVNFMENQGFTVNEIQILDSERYVMGNLCKTYARITIGSGLTPTIVIGRLFNCDISIAAQTSVNIVKQSDVENIYIDNLSNVFLHNAIIKDVVYMNRGSSLTSHALTVNLTTQAQDWMTMEASTAKLKILAASNYTRNLINNRSSSLLLINSDFEDDVYTDSNAYTIVPSA